MDKIKFTTDEDIDAFRNASGLTTRVERKKQLMRLEKEMLVDMVFNLESRNEMLVNNLIELEKMYNKLKEEK